MKHPIVFDLESGPLPKEELDALAPEFKPAANLKDPDKIKASIDEKRQDYYERAALSPVTGRVLAIGLDLDGEFSMLADDNEATTISMFWNLVQLESTHQFIGFNIAFFDMPFLFKRSLKLGVPVPLIYDNRRYLSSRFIDLMQVWQCGDRSETISLDRLARFFGVVAKSGSGKEFAGLWDSDRPKAVEYLKNDISMTRKCAERMRVMAVAGKPLPEIKPLAGKLSRIEMLQEELP